MNKIQQYGDLLENFSKLPKKEIVLPTYLEISGQPHFENVCSNILSFFFDTSQNHKFKDLLLKSLLDCVDESISAKFNLDTKNIYREFYANENKRIDLVIECNDLVITIENKIYHWLSNDLNLYEKSVLDKYEYKEKNVFIVLSLKKEDIRSSSFVNVTYDSFFSKLKQSLGYYFVNANNQYTTFLIDFIKSIENLTYMESIDKEYFKFLINNNDIIEELYSEKNKLNNSLISLVGKVMKLLPPSRDNRNMWLYQKTDIVNDFTFGDVVISLDTAFHLNKVSSVLWVRKKNNKGIYETLDDLQLIKEFSKFKKNRKSSWILYY
ncbi:PD-(D/E)XK nuclease family protein [Flavobacterium sp. ACAM 123]|uniref:PD-(D/E)XK nuclease family protein n=1 Tax=Flavobacterium sp. ACAM 123 TaxID=1189620 RepID=UPI0002F3285D|nr:PD-(D/E)XK nuclease family protein [Flavobacterium sp. ACAM 123]